MKNLIKYKKATEVKRSNGSYFLTNIDYSVFQKTPEEKKKLKLAKLNYKLSHFKGYSDTGRR